MSEAYDPNAVEEKPKSGYVTRRDALTALVIVLIGGVLLWPWITSLLEDRNKHVCKDNMGRISTALLLYAEENTNRLPPLYVAAPDYGPELFAVEGEQRKAVLSWMTLIAAFVDQPKERFKCPSAQAEELVLNLGPDDTVFESSYGMFAALSAQPLEGIPNPSTTALIAESSSNGARDTYNPRPFEREDGEVVPDGFVLGFDSTNFLPTDQASQRNQAEFATRLAFYGTKEGRFTNETSARHSAGIHMLFADRRVKTVKAPIAQIRRLGRGNEIIGTWTVP